MNAGSFSVSSVSVGLSGEVPVRLNYDEVTE